MIQKCAIPGKGQGFIATELIPKGATIKRENPSFILNYKPIISETFEMIYMILTDPDESKFEAFQTLAPLDLEHYKVSKSFVNQELVELITHKKDVHTYLIENYSMAELNLYVAKCFCNVFGFGNEAKPCILLESTFFNHSCFPNATFVAYEEGNVQQMLFVACRDIQPGDEVTISYISNIKDGKKKRHDALKPYGFTCNCERCIERNRVKLEDYKRIISSF